MNARQYVDPQAIVVFVAALFAFVAARAGEPLAAGIMIGAAVVLAVVAIARVCGVISR